MIFNKAIIITESRFLNVKHFDILNTTHTGVIITFSDN